MNNNLYELFSPQEFLLCWPLLSPQIVGVKVGDPFTWNVSVQFPAEGCAVVKEMKSKRKQDM